MRNLSPQHMTGTVLLLVCIKVRHRNISMQNKMIRYPAVYIATKTGR